MKFLLILSIVITIVMIVSPREDNIVMAKPVSTMGDKPGAVAHFKSNNEPNVLYAKWTARNTLVLGMRDDGTNRDGYANYACQVLIDNFGFRGQSVSIFIKDAKLKRLGKSFCS